MNEPKEDLHDPIADIEPKQDRTAKDYFLWALVLVGTTAILGAIFVPNFIRARSRGQLTACKSNLKNIGTSLEMYSTDFAGKYPTSMAGLTPNYLKVIPECPTAGHVTYSDSYTTVDPKGIYENYYEYRCEGSNHEAVGIEGNYPRYDAVDGLIERAP